MDLAHIFDDEEETGSPHASNGTSQESDPFLMQGDEHTWTMEDWAWDPLSFCAAPKDQPAARCCTALKRKHHVGQPTHEQAAQAAQQALLHSQQQQQAATAEACTGMPKVASCCSMQVPMASTTQQQAQAQQAASCCNAMSGFVAAAAAAAAQSAAEAALYNQVGTCAPASCTTAALNSAPGAAAAAVAVGGGMQAQPEFAHPMGMGMNSLFNSQFSLSGMPFPAMGMGMPQHGAWQGPAAMGMGMGMGGMPAVATGPMGQPFGGVGMPGPALNVFAPAVAPPGFGGSMPPFAPSALPALVAPNLGNGYGSTPDSSTAMPHARHGGPATMGGGNRSMATSGNDAGHSGHNPSAPATKPGQQHINNQQQQQVAGQKHKLKDEPDSDGSGSDGEGDDGAAGPQHPQHHFQQQHHPALSDHNSADDLAGVVALHDLPDDGKMVCQVSGCGKDLTGLKEYHQRYRICEVHIKLPQVLKDRRLQRFCQQCGRFHELTAFDGVRKSCRDQLSKHNARRRRRAQVESQKAKADGTAAGGVAGGDMAAAAAAMGGAYGAAAGGDGAYGAAAPGAAYGAGAAAAAAGGAAAGGVEGDVGRLLTTLMSNPQQLHALRLLLGVQTHPALPTPASVAAGPSSDHLAPAAPAEPTTYGLARDVLSGRGDFAPGYSSDARAVRVSMKLFNKTPADLPIDLRAQITTWLATAPSGMEACIRPGCVFLTVQARVDAATAAAVTAPGSAASLVQHLLTRTGSAFWWGGMYTVQVGKEIIRVHNGEIKDTRHADTAGMFPSLSRMGPLAFVPGQPMQLSLAGTNLDLPNCSVVVRWSGRNAKVPLVAQSATRASVQLPALPGGYVGPVWVEVERGAFLSPARPLLAVACQEMAAEINTLESKRVLRSSVQCCLLADLGHVLQHISAHSGAAPAAGAGAGAHAGDDASHAATAACALRALGFACDMGWTHTVQALLPLACARCACAGHVLSAVEASHAAPAAAECCVAPSSVSASASAAARCCLSPLHRAVRSRSPQLLAALLSWGDAHGHKWRVDCRAGPSACGLTPLHLAALMDDPSPALMLLDHCAWPAAFTQVKTSDGVTPFHLAFQMGYFSLDALLPQLHSAAAPVTPAAPGSRAQAQQLQQAQAQQQDVVGQKRARRPSLLEGAVPYGQLHDHANNAAGVLAMANNNNNNSNSNNNNGAAANNNNACCNNSSHHHAGELLPCEVCQSTVPPLMLSIQASCASCGRRRACMPSAKAGASRPAAHASAARGAAASHEECCCGAALGPASVSEPYNVCAAADHSTLYSITALCQACHANRCLEVSA